MECIQRQRFSTSGYERASLLLMAGVLITGLVALQAWADAMSHSLLIDVTTGTPERLSLIALGAEAQSVQMGFAAFGLASLVAAGAFIVAERRRLAETPRRQWQDPDREISHHVEQLATRQLLGRFFTRTVLYTGTLLSMTLAIDLYLRSISPETAGTISFAVPSVALIGASVAFAAVAAIVTIVGARTLVAMRRLRLQLVRLVLRNARRRPPRPAKMNERPRGREAFGDDVLSRPPPSLGSVR